MSNVTKKIGVFDWVFLVLAIIYAISPIDLIPDVPGVGWIDDAVFLLSSSLNLLQKKIGETNVILSTILNVIKIVVIFLGILIVLVLLLTGTLIFELIKK